MIATDAFRPVVATTPGGPSPPRRRAPRADGFTLIELLFALSILGTTMVMAVPAINDAIDELRTSMAARALAGRLAGLRMDAVTRSRCLALRFEPSGADYRFTTYVDGNGNGIRTVDIAAGVDTTMGITERLGEKFPGVSFGLMNGYPDADLATGGGSDGVRIGSARILTMSPDGTATAGTLYLHGARSQFAIRIIGSTGRVRLLQYVPSSRTWTSR